jgi:hypothetical protein
LLSATKTVAGCETREENYWLLVYYLLVISLPNRERRTKERRV